MRHYKTVYASVKLPFFYLIGLWLFFSGSLYAETSTNYSLTPCIRMHDLQNFPRILPIIRDPSTPSTLFYQEGLLWGQFQRNMQRLLTYFEQQFTPSDPLNPEKNSFFIPQQIGIGSMTTGFTLPELLPGKHLRRLAGFSDFVMATEHISMIKEYISRLEKLGIKTTPTELFPVPDRQSGAVVYVVQPFLFKSKKERAYTWLITSHKDPEISEHVKKARVKHFFEKQFAIASKILSHNREHPDQAITVDIVPNNWQLHWTDDDYELRLNDVAQPMYKDEQGHQIYQFADIASYLISPVAELTQDTLVEQMSELYTPRNLLIQMLWGYDDFGGLPEDALSRVNELLSQYEGPEAKPITEIEIREALNEDQWLLACFFRYRNWSTKFRWWLSQYNLAKDSVHMDISSQMMEMYSSKDKPYWFSCLAYELLPNFF